MILRHIIEKDNRNLHKSPGKCSIRNGIMCSVKQNRQINNTNNNKTINKLVNFYVTLIRLMTE